MDIGHRGNSQNEGFLESGEHRVMKQLKMRWKTWMLEMNGEGGEEGKNGQGKGCEATARQSQILHPPTEHLLDWIYTLVQNIHCYERINNAVRPSNSQAEDV